MKEKIYKISPLKFVGKFDKENPYACLTANTRFGNYCIYKRFEDRQDWQSQYYWTYCFDEYYDENKYEADSLKECKEKAQIHWENSISQCLTEIK